MGVLVCSLALLAFSHIRLLRRVDALLRERDLTKAELQSEQAVETANDETAKSRQQPQDESAALSTSIALPSQATAPAMQNRLTTLEKRLDDLTRGPQKIPGVRAVAEYDVSNPSDTIEPPPGDPEPPSRRQWGEEQALGPPDTAQATDAITAWASREPDSGAEWLSLDFDNPVEVAEVRIRESFNPGAITKVTGLANGREVVLWEGSATQGPAPRDFVIPVNQNIQSSSITVHLDTSLVPGWNEIDAVELVGRDGSHQWATRSTASSTYAERISEPHARRGFDFLQGQAR
jgi:hypothetical protein